MDKAFIENPVEAYEKLKQECERLKEKINSLVCSENCYKYKQAEKLKQTLAEIKDIAEQGVKIHDDIIVSKQILQKISEVIE